MSIKDITLVAKTLWDDIKNAKAILKKGNAIQVSSEKERKIYEKVANDWFSLLSKQLVGFGVSSEIVERYDNAFRSILKLSDSVGRRTSYIKQFDIISSDFNDNIVIFLQTDAQKSMDSDYQFGDEVHVLLDKISDSDENEYLTEALGCWESGYLKAATVLLWCAAIDRIHKVIEKIGFNVFNSTSSQMKQQTSGRFKRFSKEYNVQSLSELRTVFDSDVLWIIEGMLLIDSNERTRLASCFDMRCHSGHPGAAPITKYNVISCFSDIVEIIFTNPKFSLMNSTNISI